VIGVLGLTPNPGGPLEDDATMLKVIGMFRGLFDALEVTTNVSVYVPMLRPAG
jgi:hypothetical protein